MIGELVARAAGVVLWHVQAAACLLWEVCMREEPSTGLLFVFAFVCAVLGALLSLAVRYHVRDCGELPAQVRP